MELKVWVEGIQRIVCGVTETTTCQDVVYALAHATGKTGRFTLIERWRNSERLLAPHEHPLKILLKWGEYASDVQFILQRTALEPKVESKHEPKTSHNQLSHSRPTHSIPGAPHRMPQKGIALEPPTRTAPHSPPQNRDIKKSLTFSGGHSSHLSQPYLTMPSEVLNSSPCSERKEEISNKKTKHSQESSSVSSGHSQSNVINSIRESPLKQTPSTSPNNVANDDSGDINDNTISSISISIPNNNNISSNNSIIAKSSKDSPVKDISRDGERHVVRDIIKQFVKDSTSKESSSISNYDQQTEEVIVDGYYRELVRLVNQQREKISAQQVDLTKYEAEIAFAEGRWREEESRLTFLQEEIQRLEKLPEDQTEVVKCNLEQLEEQFKAAKNSESSIQEEILAIQNKLSSCDHQLTQMKSKIRSLNEALNQEEQILKKKAEEAFQEEEQEAILREIEKLQAAVEQASKQAEHAHGVSQQLTQEMNEAEKRLGEKKQEIERLKQAMRDANLEALSMTPPEDAKALSESRTGNSKAGTSRRMLGSPRQLETAVPTSKNPHGVWV